MKYIKLLRQMKEILQEKNLSYMQFYVHFVKAILPNLETGKKLLIVTNHMPGMEEAV